MGGVVATINTQLVGQYQGAAGLASAPNAQFNINPQMIISSGLLAGQADLCYMATRTIAASGSDNIDLSGTTFQDPLNVNLAMAKVCASYVKAAPGNTNNVVIGNGTNPFVGPFGAAAHTLALTPGDWVLITNSTLAGWGVTAATADILKIANSGGSTGVTYDIAV